MFPLGSSQAETAQPSQAAPKITQGTHLMAQLHSIEPPVSPLLLSDRLISLAEQAEQVGCTATARHLVRLASSVLDEKRARAPRSPRAPSRAPRAYRAG